VQGVGRGDVQQATTEATQGLAVDGQNDQNQQHDPLQPRVARLTQLHHRKELHPATRAGQTRGRPQQTQPTAQQRALPEGP